ncbi:MAG: acetylxylan esterase [Pleurocapsa minor GSE-CHR-MK-17-07R]|jgi:cephalosporin-C deacetylase|nr:acetylxylan esterase [Pleurocapsa minor GSE-CHR-MK 17-07R]
MPYFDLPFDDMQRYKPASPEQPDFDSFWARTRAEARSYPLDFTVTPVDMGIVTADVFDAEFSGYGGQRIKGWFMLPKQRSEPLPCVVEYIGYGGGRSLPYAWLKWVSAGFAYLVMDTRGQGSTWASGDTPDLPDGANPFFPGFTTQGILSPETYYYRRLYTDAVRALEAVASHPAVDRTRIAATGGSQGGAITLAASGLAPELVSASLPDVPFLCEIHRAITLIGGVYDEIVKYLSIHRQSEAQALKTLSYFDGVSFASRIRAASYFSTSLMDMICPPSCVYAAYNHIPDGVEKEIHVYKYNGHEGGGDLHTMKKILWLRDKWMQA